MNVLTFFYISDVLPIMQKSCCKAPNTPIPAYRPSKFEVADIFRKYGKQYRDTHNLPVKHLKVMNSIEHCRDGEFGYRVDICDCCGHTAAINNSCRDRHCPKCTGISRRKWVDARLADILPIPYYHAVFTLPHQFFPLSLYNMAVICELLFKCSADTLEQFAKDEKWLGAKIGFYGILHTWGGKMWQHLHVHYIVTGGGLSDDGEWIGLKYKKKFLFPVKALSTVFRAKYIESLKKAHKNGELVFPESMSMLEEYSAFDQWLLHTFPQKWVVFAKSPFAGAKKVVKYLGLYSHRVAISNYRLIGEIDGDIQFHYKFHDKKEDKVCWDKTQLEPMEFIRRFLMHVLPQGFHRIRHYGLFTNGKCKENVRTIRKILATEEPHELSPGDKPRGKRCPRCNNGHLIPIFMVIGTAFIIINLSAYWRLITRSYQDTS